MNRLRGLLELQRNMPPWFPKLSSFVMLAALRIFIHFTHEMWRDETHVTLIARDLSSYGDLLHWQSFDQGPVLWASLLYNLKQLGLDPAQAGPAITLVASIILLAIIFYGLPRIPLIFRVLLGSSYILMYEYTALARPYPLAALLLGVFVMLEMRGQKHFLWKSFVLLFLALCGSVGLIAAIAMAVYLLARSSGEPVKTRVAGAGVILTGVVLAILSALPSEEFVQQDWVYNYQDHMLDGWGVPRLLETSARIALTGFLFIPTITSDHWWSPTTPTGPASLLASILSYHPLLTYAIGLAAIGAGLWVLRRLLKMSRPVGLAAAVVWGAYLVGFSYLTPGFIRHFGIIVLCTLALFALARSMNPTLRLRWMTAIVGVVLVIQSMSGIWSVYAEQRDVFSEAKAAASWLQENYPEATPTVYPDHMGATLSVYTGSPYHSLSAGTEVTFVRETEEHVRTFSPEMVTKDNFEGEDPLLITNFPFHALLDEGRTIVEPLKYFGPAVAPGEDYYIHSVSFQDEQSDDEKWALKLLPFEGPYWTVDSSEYVRPESFLSLPDLRLDNGTGSTIEIEMKFLHAAKADPGAFVLQLLDGKRPLLVSFFEDGFSIQYDLLATRYEVDTTDAFHVYRFTLEGNNVKAYVDGTKIGSSYVTAGTDQKGVLLRNEDEIAGATIANEENVTVQIAHVAYSASGASPPEGESGSEAGEWTTFDAPATTWAEDGNLAVKAIDDGVLTMGTRGVDFGYVSLPVPEFDNTAGSAAEVRLRLLSGPRRDADGAVFSIADGRREARVSFFTDRILISAGSDVKAVRWMDTTDDFHTYRIAMVEDTLKVYVDGVEAASAALSGSTQEKRVLLGDLSTADDENMSAKVDHLAYWAGGAMTPEGAALEPLEGRPEETGKWTEARWGFIINTTASETDPCGTGNPIEGFNNSTGSTVEVKMKILAAPAAGSDGAMLSLIDGSREGKISFHDDRIEIRDQNQVKASHNMDTTDGFHAYRIVIIEDTMKVYVDGSEVASVTLSGSSTDRKILFGDLSSHEGENLTAQVEYLAYSVDGALTPDGAPLKPTWEKGAGEWTEVRQSFSIETSGTETDPTGTRYPIEGFDNSTGSTAEVKLKLVEGPYRDGNGAIFSLADGRREGGISFFTDHIAILDGNDVTAVRWMDTTDDFHSYRIAIIEDTLGVYVDGDEVSSTSLSAVNTEKKITFGDLSPQEGENLTAQVEYLAYSVDGALTPGGAALQPAEGPLEQTGHWTEVRWGLIVDTTGSGTDPCGTGYPIEGFDNSTGSTVEVRMRISEAPASGSDGAMLSLIDGSREGKISFYRDHITIRDTNTSKSTYWMDTTDGFHTYRITIVENSLRVFVDGVEAASVSLSGSNTDKKILFGDLSPQEGENFSAQVEYLAYSVEGATQP